MKHWLKTSIERLTYLLTPWCRVLLEKLTGLQLVKKFPVFHGTRRFITALTSALHLCLSWASPIQSIYPHPTSWRSILIFTYLRLGLPNGLFPSGFPLTATILKQDISCLCSKSLWIFSIKKISLASGAKAHGIFKVIATYARACWRFFHARYQFLVLYKSEDAIFKQDIFFLTVPNLVDTFVNEDNSC